MKITTQVRVRYRIDYEKVLEFTSRLKGHCQVMQEKAMKLKKSVPEVHDQICSDNYNKAQAIAERMLKEIGEAEMHLDELLDSCSKFAKKVQETHTIAFPK